MPAKILLADKSITIQKVVEMLFAGREYEVVSVSDGETALSEAERVAPDVVLADVDLPRVDGYSLAERLKKNPAFAQTPVILMMSRDDIYDANKGKQAGILDNIVKPFESQELIGKVKKALAAAPPRLAEPAASRPTAAMPPKPAAAPVPPRPAATAASPASTTPKMAPSAAKQKPVTPADIFDIIDEAPTPSDLKQAAPSIENESVYEVEPVVEEVEEPLPREVAKALPVGPKAVEEMRAGLGLALPQEEAQPEIVTFESFDMSMEAEQGIAPAVKPAASVPEAPYPAPPVQPTLPESELRSIAEETIAKMAKEVFAKLPPVQPPTLPESELRSIAEETIAKMTKDVFAKLPPVQPPQVSDDLLRSMVEEKVAHMAKTVLEKLPAAQPGPLSPSDMWSVAEEMFAKMAKELFEKQSTAPASQISDEALRRMVEETAAKTMKEMLDKAPVPQPSPLSETELRQMADAKVTKMAEDIFKAMPPPPMPKISDETVRRGLEDAIWKIAHEVAKEVIEQVAWEVIPQLAEQMIKEEIERLRAME